jgi:phosphoribosylglycinamide formyltransferase 1
VSLRLAVLISGRGSNLGAILEAARDPAYPARPVLVVSNVAGAGGLALAAQAGVASRVIPHQRRTREAFEAELDGALREAGAEIVALAGFLRVLTPGFVAAWEGRLLNIHPSLLPAFPGLDTHARALAAGVKLHGCTVHLVSAGVDEGPILAQAAVPVLADDDEASLAARVLAQEHALFPGVIAVVARGALRLGEGRATLLAPPGEGALANPALAHAMVS